MRLSAESREGGRVVTNFPALRVRTSVVPSVRAMVIRVLSGSPRRYCSPAEKWRSALRKQGYCFGGVPECGHAKDQNEGQKGQQQALVVHGRIVAFARKTVNGCSIGLGWVGNDILKGWKAPGMNQRLRNNHDELIRRAQEALDGSVFDEAEATRVRRALMLDPQSLDARQIIASALIEQNRFEEASPFWMKFWFRNLMIWLPLPTWGFAFSNVANSGPPKRPWPGPWKSIPQDPQASYWMALCVERKGQYDLAEEYFRQAHEADPEAYPLPTRVSRGSSKERCGKPGGNYPKKSAGP